MSFESLGLRTELIRAVHEKGYDQPTPIQQQAIPAILEGRDLMGGAQTGTGKTAGFTLPLLQRLSDNEKSNPRKRVIRSLILTPTRELASQVSESIQTYGKFLPITSTVVFGGVNINPQKKILSQGVDVLVATPGRLLDHAAQKTVDLSKVEILVLDEADRMLDMGFIHDIKKVLALLPRAKQTLLFSATFSAEIKKLAGGLLKNPQLIQVAPQNTTTDQVSQIIHPVDKARKRELLSFLIGSNNWKQVLVFNRTKHGSNRLAEQLNKDGISASAIHGNKSQAARTRALADFKSGKVRVLVATDIAARGLDIKQLPHVVNFELPNVAEDYVHRIGRTGRAGHEGEAMSLVCADEIKLLKGIEKLISRKIPQQVIEGYQPSTRTESQAVNRRPPPKQRKPGQPQKMKVGGNAKRNFKGRQGKRTEHSTQTI